MSSSFARNGPRPLARHQQPHPHPHVNNPPRGAARPDAFPPIQLCYEQVAHKKVPDGPSVVALAVPAGLPVFVWVTARGECRLVHPQRTHVWRKVHCAPLPASLWDCVLFGTQCSIRQRTSVCLEDIYWLGGRSYAAEQSQGYQGTLTQLLAWFQQQVFASDEVQFGLPVMTTQTSLEATAAQCDYAVAKWKFRRLHGAQRWWLRAEPLTNQALSVAPALPIAPKPAPSASAMAAPRRDNNPPAWTLPPRLKGSAVVGPALEGGAQGQGAARPPTPKLVVMQVSADPEPDIYHLHQAGRYCGVALIPSYRLSVAMNRLFRRVRANENLDSIEESDDEDEFQNQDPHRHVNLQQTHELPCAFHPKFKKWVPVLPPY